MKKDKLTGWKNVFSFTLLQTAKSKSFLSSTITMGIIFFALMVGINIYGANSNDSTEDVVMEEDVEEVTEDTEIKDADLYNFAHSIVILDETGLGLSMDEMQEYVNKKYEATTFTAADSDHDTMIEDMENGNSDSAYVHIGYDESGIAVDLYLPTDSLYGEEDAERFARRVSKYIERWKETALGLSEEQEGFLTADITSTVIDPNEESMTEMFVNMYVPMILCLVLYMCIIMYGQMVGNSVATEKSSKVMELLLTSVRPLAVIVGKVLSMMALSLLQLLGFLVIILAGNSLGTMLAQNINPEYENIVMELLTDFNLLTILSPVRILFALVVFILGFTFYCTFAGLMGATVNRGEDLSSAMSVYSTVSVFGFILAYLPDMFGEIGEGFTVFASIFPLSSPFILPAKILTGELSIGICAIGTAVLAVVVVLFVVVVAKVYEMVILYTGNKVGFKEMKKMFASAKTEA